MNISEERLNKPIFLDVIADGRFIRQFTFKGKPRVKFYKGKEPVYDDWDFREFVFEQMPHLRNKNVEIIVSNQLVKRRR